MIAGDLLGRYEIVRLLGEGGMGKVYLATDPVIDRRVAIKMCTALDTDDLRARFLREAKKLGKLSHINIVGIFDVDERDDDGSVFIVMEYVEGRTLSQMIRENRPGLGYTLRILQGICDGLSAAHEKGVVHRDIKPANLIVDTKGVVKILDFGIAKDAEADGYSKPGQTPGTLVYMSPEQLHGEPIGPRTDMFATCLVAYELLTGQRVFRGNREEICAAISIARIPPMSRYTDGVPAELEQVIRRGLARDPQDRFNSMRSLRRELVRLEREFGDGYDSAINNSTISSPVITLPGSVASVSSLARSRSVDRVSPTFVPDDYQSLGQPEVAPPPSQLWKAIAGVAGAGALVLAWALWPGRTAPAPPAASTAAPPVAAEPVAGTLADGASTNAPSAATGQPATTTRGQAQRPTPVQAATSGPAMPIAPPLSQTLGVVPSTQPDSKAASGPLEPSSGAPSAAAPGGATVTPYAVPSAPPPAPAAGTVTAYSAPSSPPATPPLSPRTLTAADDAALRSTLRAFENAFQDLSSAALKQVQPSLTGDQLTVWDRAFADNTSYRVSILDPRVSLTAPDQARVDCAIVRTFTSKTSQDTRTLTSRPAVIYLSRLDNVWVISMIRGNGW